MASLSNNSNGIVQFLENKTLLVTGGTGFLAKIFVEKVLRIQPNVKKIYLLIRASDSNSATQRFQNEVVAKELFRVLREKWGSNLESFISEKVNPLAGDISCDNLGLKDSNMREEMWKEVDIIVNLAATTNFDERYDVAMGINTWGALRVLTFAKKCVKLKMLLHVSTAYVCGERAGLIQEKPFDMGGTLNGSSKLNIHAEKQLVEEMLTQLEAQKATEEAVTSAMKELGMKRARLHGWPNTYVFTKAMGEMLLGKYYKEDDMPLVITRPTMVTSTFQEPFSGWIEGLRTIDSVILGFAKGKVKCLPIDPDLIFDAIPADMVVNSMLVAIVAHVNQYSSFGIIYHVGSSFRNPVKYSNLIEFSMQYFTKNPFTYKNGKPIKVRKVLAFNTVDKFHKYMTTHYVLPLKGLQLVNKVLCRNFNDMYVDFNRKIKSVMRLVDFYKPFLFFKGIFDDTNSEKLRMAAREMGMEAEDDAFNFDSRRINWEDYFMNIHIPGLVKHAINKPTRV